MFGVLKNISVPEGNWVKTSIIIPQHNGVHMLSDCIASIKQHTTQPYEIIVVDNGSSDESVDYCLHEDVILVSLSDNKGFPAACNLGMKVASGSEILLLNNDVLVAPGWLEKMLNCLYSEEQIGIVGPMSNFISGKQQISFPYTDLVSTAAYLAKHHAGEWLEVKRIVGLCFLFKRELMDKIGVLDERFSPGHYEDDDYCYRARLAGYKLMIVKDAFVFHYGSASFSKIGEEEVNRLIAINREKFIQKWGEDPNQFI